MKWNESWLIKYFLLAAIVTAWMIRASIDSSPIGLVYSVVGLLVIVSSVALYVHGRLRLEILCNEEAGLVAIIRPVTVELYSLMLIQSVPIGIDLSENARGVLRSMWTHFSEEAGGEISFVMCRPLENGPTRLGFMIVRRGLRPMGTRFMERLTEKMTEDSTILKASMNAAYPHVSVVLGTASDILMITSGGMRFAERS